MSFLKGTLGDIVGTISPAAGLASGQGLGQYLPMLSPAAMLMGLGSRPSHDNSVADSIGKAANVVAQAGGAGPGYQTAPAVPVQNHLQNLDPAVIQQLINSFGGGAGYRTDVGPTYGQRVSY